MEIDYDQLKKRGFLRQKQEGYFVLRTRALNGIYSQKQMEKLSEISINYGRGFIHTTVRQGIEVPFIKFQDIGRVELELKRAEIQAGTSGARLRATTVCPGNNWCKSGLVNTFALAARIEKELGIVCGLDLPHKFKIAISGCPNTCTRPQASEIGIHGQAYQEGGETKFGYTVYLGGCAGRTPRAGLKPQKVFTEEEVLSLVEGTVKFYKEHAKPRQRLALLIEEKGKDDFLKAIGIEQQKE